MCFLCCLFNFYYYFAAIASSSEGRIFGISLEKCIQNDLCRSGGGADLNYCWPSSSSSIASDSAGSSRNSIASLLDPRAQQAAVCTESCESLALTASPRQSGRGDLHFIETDNRQHKNDHSSNEDSSSLHQYYNVAKEYDDSPLSLLPLPGIIRPQQLHVPSLVSVCIDFLYRYGLNTVGIFRLSTAKRRLILVNLIINILWKIKKNIKFQLREELDHVSSGPLKLDDNSNPHDIAGLLKDYLRALPEPLLCRNLYTAFLQTQRK